MHVFNSPVIAQQQLCKLHGRCDASSMLTLSKSETSSVAVPPPPEQRAIAAALSDVDALLGALDRLIAKKRDLKQAAMQQLLTGQTRLPGFHGEWEVKRLGDLQTLSQAERIDRKTYIGVPSVDVRHDNVSAYRTTSMLSMFSIEQRSIPNDYRVSDVRAGRYCSCQTVRMSGSCY